jgi:hypothetical protein
VVSPTATDALNFYQYYLADTLYLDDQRVFRLEIEPKDPTDPLFVGTIDIADSNFSVVGVDVGFSEGMDLQVFDSLRFAQRYAEFDKDCWLPVEIDLEGLVNLPIPGIPTMSFDYQAVLHDYDLRPELTSGRFDISLEVAETADDLDSIEWAMGQTVPLTVLEERGYRYQDSLVHAPRPLPKQLLSGMLRLTLAALTEPTMFHFNRVEGAYLGRALTIRPGGTGLRADIAAGYAFEAEKWQYALGLSRRFGHSRPFEFSVEYHDRVEPRSSLISPRGYNPTFSALVFQADPFDYYLEKGFNIDAWVRLRRQLTFGMEYQNLRHASIATNTGFSVFGDEDEVRANPVVAEGRLNLLRAYATFDTRSLIKLKHQEGRVDDIPRTVVRASGELSSPSLLDSDFDYVRYMVSFSHARPVLGLGLFRLYAAGGVSDRSLPPQKYFSIDFSDVLFSDRLHFNTLDQNNFVGSRAGLICAQHDFGSRLFKLSRLPLIRQLPLSLFAYGGAFWSDLHNNPRQAGDDLVRTAPRTYSELGFGIGRIPPFSFKLLFSWQLSNYKTTDFALGIGFDLFGN